MGIVGLIALSSPSLTTTSCCLESRICSSTSCKVMNTNIELIIMQLWTQCRDSCKYITKVIFLFLFFSNYMIYIYYMIFRYLSAVCPGIVTPHPWFYHFNSDISILFCCVMDFCGSIKVTHYFKMWLQMSVFMCILYIIYDAMNEIIIVPN